MYVVREFSWKRIIECNEWNVLRDVQIVVCYHEYEMY